MGKSPRCVHVGADLSCTAAIPIPKGAIVCTLTSTDKLLHMQKFPPVSTSSPWLSRPITCVVADMNCKIGASFIGTSSEAVVDTEESSSKLLCGGVLRFSSAKSC